MFSSSEQEVNRFTSPDLIISSIFQHLRAFQVVAKQNVRSAIIALMILIGLTVPIGTAVAAGIDSLAHLANRTDSAAKIDSSAAKAALLADSPPGPDRTIVPGLFDFITNLPGDWYHYTVQTVTWDHAPLIGLVAASTVGLIAVDRQWWLPLYHDYNVNTPFFRLSNFFVDVGDGGFQFALAGAFGAYGVLAPKSENTDRALRTASQTCEVILACGGVVQLLKHVTGRQSPFVSTSATGLWVLFPNQIDYLKHTSSYDAFPSGHLSTALATLIVIANNYPEVTWIRPFGYVMCAGLSAGLVAQGIHWWSDFPLAIALGYGFATLVSPPQAPGHTGAFGSTEGGLSKLLAQTTYYPTITAGSPGVGLMTPF